MKMKRKSPKKTPEDSESIMNARVVVIAEPLISAVRLEPLQLLKPIRVDHTFFQAITSAFSSSFGASATPVPASSSSSAAIELSVTPL
jgi:hypothetical protein